MKLKSASAIFLFSYFGIGVLYSIAFLIAPITKNGISALLFPIFAWPFIECWGVMWVNLPWLAFLVFVSIITSLLLQAKYISQSSERLAEQLNSPTQHKQRSRLRVIIGLEAFLLLSVVILPLEHAFVPLSLLMWASNCLPIGIFALRTAKKKVEAQDV